MPDAWDDDWIANADDFKSPKAKADPPPSNAKISKAERRAKQAEFNRKIWEDAERPEDNFFLKSQGVVPLQTEFKPIMKVLSRKPIKAKVGADPSSGIGQLLIDDDDDDDEEAGKNNMTLEERQAKAQREREEKRKAYDERRRQLFGQDEEISSAPTSAVKKSGASRTQSRAKEEIESRPSSSASNTNRQLYDPNESIKPDNLRIQKKEATPNEIQPIREPKGPDASGRGGFGFAPRGGRST